MYWWQHDEKTPAVSSGKIQRGFTIKAKKEHPREFEDYEISWDVEGCKQPEEF
jgi:CRISPR/Cas system type I-B associated protein Csh2 (Cas7 group RAMP superfamily)